MSLQSAYPVTTYVNQADFDRLLTDFEGTDYRVVVLNGETITSKESLFAQTQQDLPLPEDYKQVHNWASFEDCLWNMVFSFDEERIVIVWSHVERMLEGGLEVFMTAADILTSLARRLYEKQLDLSVFFVGIGPNFPRLQPKNRAE